MAIKRTETRMRTGSPRRAAMRILRMRRTRRHHTSQQRLCPLSITRYKYSIKTYVEVFELYNYQNLTT